MGVPDEREYPFAEGQRVVVLASPFYGFTGTLVRRAWLLGQRAWLVELDVTPRRFTIRRTRIAEAALAPAEAVNTVRGDRPRARSTSARARFAVLVPLVPAAWIALPPVVALMFSGVVAGLFIVGFLRRRRDNPF